MREQIRNPQGSYGVIHKFLKRTFSVHRYYQYSESRKYFCSLVGRIPIDKHPGIDIDIHVPAESISCENLQGPLSL